MRTAKWSFVIVVAALLAAPAAWAEKGGAEWEFSFHPQLWIPSLDLNTGTGDVTTDVQKSASDILQGLEIVPIPNLGIRRNRWGLMTRGVYAKIDAQATEPGPFFALIETTMELGILDLELFYRVIEGNKGYLDVLAGGRYVHLGMDFDLQPDYAAAASISASVIDQAVNSVGSQVGRKVDAAADRIAAIAVAQPAGEGAAARNTVMGAPVPRTSVNSDYLMDQVDRRVVTAQGAEASLGGRRGTIGGAFQAELDQRLEQSIGRLENAIQTAMAERIQGQVDRAVAGVGPGAPLDTRSEAVRQAIQNAASAKLDELKRTASAKTRKAIEEAERALTAAVTDAMTAVADADLSETHEWVEPYVGLRGRLILPHGFYAGARGDVGGFGAGSDLTWQVFAGLGWQIQKHVALEAGWRHLVMEYEEDDFVFDTQLSGMTFGLGITF